eukprot:scaffold494_cov22-Phaeocystis_antarctica.AAC.1
MPSGKIAHHPGWKPLQGSADDHVPGWLQARAGSPDPFRGVISVILPQVTTVTCRGSLPRERKRDRVAHSLTGPRAAPLSRKSASI